jgi:hypothetical protein
MSWARVAGIGSVAFVSAAAAAGLQLWSVDLERAFAEAAVEIRQASGLDIAVAGDFALEMSWPPRAVAETLTIANPAWATRPSVAVVQRVEAELDILPLLAGEARPRRVLFTGVDLLLERDPDGLKNWAIETAESRRALPAEWTTITSSLTDLVIQRGRVSFIDHATKEERTVSLGRLAIHAEDNDEPIEVEADARINAASVALAGTLGSIRQIKSGLPFGVDLRAAGAGAVIAINGQVTWPADDRPTATGLAMTIEGADLSGLGPMLDMAFPPVGSYSLSAILGTDRTGHHLSAVKLRLGRSDIFGEVFVQPKEGRSRLVATLTSTLVDLADLSSPPAAGAETSTSDAGLSPTDQLFGFALQAIDEAQVYFSGAKVVGGGFDLDGVSANMALRHDRSAIGSFEPGSGSAGTSEFADGLHGDLQVASEAGSIDPDLARRLLLDQTAVLVADAGTGIELDCMAGRFTLAPGMPMTATAVIDAPAARITGVGRVDLRAHTIDMRLTPLPKRPDLADRMVPVIARGPLNQPEVLIDPQASAGRTDHAQAANEAVNDSACMTHVDAVVGTTEAESSAVPAATDREIAAGAPPQTVRRRSGIRGFQDFLEALSNDIDAFLGSGRPGRPTPITKRESGKLR